jgi:Ca2+/Na+ antiporter
MHMLEKICCLIIWPLNRIIPVKAIPELAVAMIFCCIFAMVEFIVLVMNVFSAYTGVSHFIVGITLMVWGSDNIEMLNLAVATAKGLEEIGFTAVLSSKVMCLTFVLPFACLSRMIEHG